MMQVPIFINGRFLGKNITGVQRFAHEIVWALDTLLVEKGIAVNIKILAPLGMHAPEGLLRIGFETCGSFHGHIWEQWDLFRAAKGGLLLNLCNSGPIFHTRQLTIIHDATVFRKPENYSFIYRMLHQSLGRILALRSKIGTVSAFSREELADVLSIPKQDICVLPNGYEHILRYSSDVTVLNRLGVKKDSYFLFVGSPAPNKNLARAIEAFVCLNKSELSFVIVGVAQANMYGAANLAKHPNVIIPGRLSDNEIVALYGNAISLVFPSLYEGFGIPPLEAMALGCPAIVSRIPPLEEVCADAALYCNPMDPNDIAEKMGQLLISNGTRENLILKGTSLYPYFSWNKSAADLLDWIATFLPRSEV
jgi:glycosyltransferase involved in cell wall biosynthesis